MHSIHTYIFHPIRVSQSCVILQQPTIEKYLFYVPNSNMVFFRHIRCVSVKKILG
jgi:hypothetical protein